MKNNRTKLALKGRPFNGKRYDKSKPIPTDTRQRIRQLLRSFPPIDSLQNNAGTTRQIPR